MGQILSLLNTLSWILSSFLIELFTLYSITCLHILYPQLEFDMLFITESAAINSDATQSKIPHVHVFMREISVIDSTDIWGEKKNL